MMQRMRLPGVNDIFPTPTPTSHCTPHLRVQTFPVHTHQPAPVPLHSPVPGHSVGAPLISAGAGSPGYHHSQSQIHHQHQNMTPTPINGLPGSPIFVIDGPFNPPAYITPSPQVQYSTSPQGFSPSHTPHLLGYRVAKQSKGGIRQSNAWSYEDDCLLKHLKEVKKLGWREISLHFKNRTANGCQFRWRRIALLQKAGSSVSHSSEKGSTEVKRSNSLETLLN